MLDDKPRLRAGEIRFGEEHLYEVIEPVIRIYDQVPAGLDAVAPGPVLAAWLSSIDVSSISPYDRIVVLKAHDRLVSHFQAHRYRDMAAVAEAEADLWGDPDGVDHENDEAAAAEVRVALHLTRRSADIEMGLALEMRRRLPALFELLASGAIDVARARVIERATMHLSDEYARDVVDRIASDAPTMTTGEVRAWIRKLCLETDPEEARERYATAVDGRKVVAETTDAGTAHLLGLDLAPDRVQAITARINEIARSLRGGGESRSMDQLRADVYLDLLDGVAHDTVGRGVVDIVVDLETLAGLADHPGELAGFGPVIADVARRVVAERDDTEWRVTVTDPDTGQPIAVTTTGRRPTAAQRRRVEARDRVCVFPGCRMPARRSDIDHIEAVADGGETCDDNLAPLCRNDHCIKHAYGWTYRRLADGRYEWTSPFGHTCIATRAPP